jgi:ABC-type polysaccharide/polyol phosphate transport system ATPase subunit
MTTNIDISVVQLSKRYWVPTDVRKAKIPFFQRQQKEALWSLKEISFDVPRGEAIGIVGHNGAGKSTLVKLLAGITVPTSGEIMICGTLSALVEVGAGFNVELTGRENVYLAGAIQGMSRREIEWKMASILEFAGIGPRVDAPVKTYSSGQFVRLGFAIASQLEHDIFLLDEVLAVGDLEFQSRCFERIDGLRSSGKTMVVVSHDLAAIERICDRAILLDRGEMIMASSPRAVIEEYSKTAFASLAKLQRPSSVVKLVGLGFENPSGGAIRTADAMSARLSVHLSKKVEGLIACILFYWPSGYLCAQLTSSGSSKSDEMGEGPVMFDFTCPVLTMQRGLYRVDVTIQSDKELIEHWKCCSVLRVDVGKLVVGDFYLEHYCKVS